MLLSSFRARIIGVLLLASLAAGCAVLKLAYNQAPQLAYWWMDGYADFSEGQEPQVKQAIAEWFGWHRSTQLDDYTALLQRAQAEATGNLTPARVCEWQQMLEERAMRGFDAAVPALAKLALELTPEQLQRIERELAEKNEDFRDKELPSDPQQRLDATYKRSLKRAEQIYGRLDGAQKDAMKQALKQSPFDGERWYAERVARQQDLLKLLRGLNRQGADAQANAEQALQRWGRHVNESPRPGYRAYRDRLDQFNCGYVAEVHNATTPAQRQTARERLREWEKDLRALRAEARPVSAAPSASPRGAG